MALIISIDGNIGSGKSTLIDNLKKHFLNEDVIFLEEPINEWNKIKDENNKTILEKYYENINKYAFCFQMMTFITRYVLLLETIKQNPKAIIVTERSLYTDKHIFAKMLFDSKKINTFEYQIYNKWFDEFVKKLPEHKFIYLHTKPDTCINRIKTRSRDGEDKIDIEYLNKCNEYHDKMFEQIKYEHKFNLDDCNLESNNYTRIINEIRTYILSQNSKNDLTIQYILILVFAIISYIIIKKNKIILY
jgi:deoxyadenosine/deoxycytidine kinase